MDWARVNPFMKADNKTLEPANPRVTSSPDNKQGPKPPKSQTIPDDNNNNNRQQDDGDDPMLQFDKLWEPNLDKDGKPIPDSNDDNGPYIPQLDPKKLGDMVNKMDFMRNALDDQDLADLKEGGEKGINANLRIMQKMSRNVFTSAISAASKLAEGGFSNARKRFDGTMPERFRDLLTENELSSGIELAGDPAFAPMVGSLKKQFLKKYPKATPAEINVAINGYLNTLAERLKKPKDKTQDVTDNAAKLRKGAADADFMDWISSEVDGSRASPFADDNDDPDAQA